MFTQVIFWFKISLAALALVAVVVYLVRPGPFTRLRRHLNAQGIRPKRIRQAQPGMMEAIRRQWPKYEALYTDAQGNHHCALFDVGPWSVEMLEDRITSTAAGRAAVEQVGEGVEEAEATEDT